MDSNYLRVVCVFHPEVLEGLLEEYGMEVAANPVPSPKGMKDISSLIPNLEKYGPYGGLYCSRLSRSSAAISPISIHYDLDFCSIKGLGQHAKKEGDKVLYLPGYEHEDFRVWQEEAVKAILDIRHRHPEGGAVLILGHRPTIAGLWCHMKGINDPNEARRIANDPWFYGCGFIVISVRNDDTFHEFDHVLFSAMND